MTAMAALPVAQLSEWLEARLGVGVHHPTPVGGGCIHQAWRLRCGDGTSVFVKSNRGEALPLFEAEVRGLEALARWAPPELVVPRPLAWGAVADHAVLVLPWLDLQGGNRARSERGWGDFGRSLARLHRQSLGGDGGRGFGFDADNFIGSAPQGNSWRSSWTTFFAECRLAPQFARAQASGQAFQGAATLLDGLPALLRNHRCEPVLVHGDLWSGNAGLLEEAAALFDPACHWADREVDLAMARLFGGFPPRFFEGYGAEWPLPPGVPLRQELYNLYHLLNHANLFGGGYRQQAQQSIEELLHHCR